VEDPGLVNGGQGRSRQERTSRTEGADGVRCEEGMGRDGIFGGNLYIKYSTCGAFWALFQFS